MRPAQPRLVLSSGTLYHWPLGAIFRATVGLGFDGVELVVGPEALILGPARVASLAARSGIAITSLHPPVLPLPGWLSLKGVVEGVTRWASALGTSIATFHTADLPTLDSDKGLRYVSAVDELADGLAGAGVILALENRACFSARGPSLALDQPGALLNFAKAHRAAITFDTAHAGTLYADFTAAYEVLRPAIVNIHLSDLKGNPGKVAFHWSDTVLRHHQLPGYGILPLADFVTRVAGSGYTGQITIECSPIAVGGWRTDHVRARLAEALWFVRTRTSGAS